VRVSCHLDFPCIDFWDSISLGSPGCLQTCDIPASVFTHLFLKTGSHYVAHAGLELEILLSWPPKC
jgi:hypothetical protein